MTISEMHIAVKLGLDKSSSLELPAFEPEEIDYWLNKAVLYFINTRYSGNNIKRESFEQTQKRLDDLRTLITEATITPSVGGVSDKPNAYIAALPTPATSYLYRVGEEVNINFTESYTGSVINKRQGVTECTSDTYNHLINNPFSEHILYLKEAKPLRLYKGNNVELITDGNYTITAYYLRYLKQPATVSLSGAVSCDLPIHTHSEIIDICVGMLLENIESNRYQSFKNETMINE